MPLNCHSYILSLGSFRDLRQRHARVGQVLKEQLSSDGISSHMLPIESMKDPERSLPDLEANPGRKYKQQQNNHNRAEKSQQDRVRVDIEIVFI